MSLGTGKDSFSSILDQALGNATAILQSVETLSTGILNGTPEGIYEAAVGLETTTHESRSAVDRLIVILHEAGHHTLESAYRALIADHCYAEATKIRALEEEYRKIQGMMMSSNSHLTAILAGLNNASWHDPSKNGDTAGHTTGLLAKA